jgi:hypothetical protein
MTSGNGSGDGGARAVQCLDEALGSLVPSFVHNLNNCLVGILGNIDLAGLYTEDPGRSSERIADARKATMKIRDFLSEIVRYGSPGGEWSPESVLDMAAVARLACGRSMTLETDGTAGLPVSLPVPDTAFRAVTLGLLSWAVRSCSGAGRVRLLVRVRPGAVELTVSWVRSGTTERGGPPLPGDIPSWAGPLASDAGMTVERPETGPGSGSATLTVPVDES